MERLSTAFYAGGVIAVVAEGIAIVIEFWLNMGWRSTSIARILREWIWSMGILPNKPLVLTVHGRVLLGVVAFFAGAVWMWIIAAPDEHLRE